jgi:hypothetical protein
MQAAAKAVMAAQIATKKDPECVKVVVRCRPMSRKEVEDQRKRIVEMNGDRGEVTVRNPEADPREPAKPFTFDQVYDWNSKQDYLFETTAQPIVDSVLQGYNGTVFAYGQTGTGKTHTMEGQWEPTEMRGIIPRAFCRIFEKIEATHDQNFLVRASFLEIYNEEVRDLLSKDPKNQLELKEDNERGVFVKDLTSYVVKGVSEMENVLLAGKKNRSVGATLMNQDSSRSHSIFSIVIESSVESADGSRHIRAGKLNLVDLAGSERQSKTGATGDRSKPSHPPTQVHTGPHEIHRQLIIRFRAGSKRRLRSIFHCRHSATSSRPSWTPRASISRTVTPSSRVYYRTHWAVTQRL